MTDPCSYYLQHPLPRVKRYYSFNRITDELQIVPTTLCKCHLNPLTISESSQVFFLERGGEPTAGNAFKWCHEVRQITHVSEGFGGEGAGRNPNFAGGQGTSNSKRLDGFATGKDASMMQSSLVIGSR